MTKTFTLCAALFLAPTIACDQPDDADIEYREQVEDAEITLEGALTSIDEETEATVLDASFELGIDAGFYTVEAIIDDTLIIYEVDSMSGERVEAERRRARAERSDLARRHRHLRRRLAQVIAELRREYRDHRAVRARLMDGEVEIDLLDRRGNRRTILRRLADDRG